MSASLCTPHILIEGLSKGDKTQMMQECMLCGERTKVLSNIKKLELAENSDGYMKNIHRPNSLVRILCGAE